jgi:hypothetical protein
MKAFWAGLLLGGTAAGLCVYTYMNSIDPVTRLLEMPLRPPSDSELQRKLDELNFPTSAQLPGMGTDLLSTPEDSNVLGTIYAAQPRLQLTYDMFSGACVYFTGEYAEVPYMHFALILKEPQALQRQLKEAVSVDGTDNGFTFTSIPEIDLRQLDYPESLMSEEYPHDAITLRLSEFEIYMMNDKLRALHPENRIPHCAEGSSPPDEMFLKHQSLLGNPANAK